jgi:imidazolonepropionase-like amidohydrolase
MLKFCILSLLFLCSSVVSNSQAKIDLVISNATIIHIVDGRLQNNKDVLVKGGRIEAIVPHKNAYPRNVQIIDAKGKFLMPGLWDMHMHFGGGDSLVEENKNLLPLFVAHGITAVRDAAADISLDVLKWRNEIAAGQLLGPTIFTSGPKLEGLNSIWVGDLEIGDSNQLLAALDSLKKLRVDFIKITDNTIKPALYLEGLQEARKRNWPVSGHIPYALTMDQVVDAGLSSVEHMAYVLKAGAKGEGAIAKGIQEGKLISRDVMPLVLQQFDKKYAMQVYRRMAAKGTAVVPTLSISRVTAYMDQENHWNDAYLKYLGQGLKNTYYWRIKRAAGDSKEAIALRHQVFEKAASLLPLLQKAGVTIIAGTDAGYLNSFDYPGIGLHNELGLLVKYGLSPLQALQASIINGPKYFNKSNEYGRIKPGFFADLLLLEANPLLDISNTQKIDAVMVKGKFISRKELDALLVSIADKASKSTFKSLE